MFENWNIIYNNNLINAIFSLLLLLGLILILICLIIFVYVIAIITITFICMGSMTLIVYIVTKSYDTYDIYIDSHSVKYRYRIINKIKCEIEKHRINNLNDIPYDMICPITFGIMLDPVICNDGRSYEREALYQYIRYDDRSPFTRQPITKIEDNENLKKSIKNFLKSKGCNI